MFDGHRSLARTQLLVITSYSIHYTKLYEPHSGVDAEVVDTEYHGADTIIGCKVGSQLLALRAAGRANFAVGAHVRLSWSADDAHVFESESGRRCENGARPRDVSVITSYSIHYTKLYEPDNSGFSSSVNNAFHSFRVCDK